MDTALHLMPYSSAGYDTIITFCLIYNTHNAFLNDVIFSLVSHCRGVQLWSTVTPGFFSAVHRTADCLTVYI